MARRMISEFSKAAFAVIIAAVLALGSSTPAHAQANSGSNSEKNAFGGPRKQLATIIFAGLGGAVLGLSTLSFYGRPQDNLRNIAFGAGAGVIIGTVVVTYRAATNPAELYGTRPLLEQELDARTTPIAPRTPLTFKYAFEF